MRWIIIICIWLAILIPFIVGTQWARSRANEFLNQIPKSDKIDSVIKKPQEYAGKGADAVKNAADRIGLGGLADKVTGKGAEKVETLTATATGYNDYLRKVKEFFAPSFPGFQVNVLKLCPVITLLVFGCLLVLSIGFMLPRKPRAQAEEG